MINKKIILVFIVLILISTFNDLQISMILYNPKSLFGLFMESFAIFPTTFFLILNGIILLFKTYKKIVFKMLGIILIIIGFYVSCKFAIKEGVKLSILNSVLINSLIYIPTTLFIYKKIEKYDEKFLYKFVIICVLNIIFQNLLINVLKHIFYRPRMRFLSITSYDLFINWYQKGSKLANISNIDYILSFPSGHTSASTTILLFTLLFKNNKTYIISYIFIFLTALFRIIIGAHFLSDVSFGMIIGILVITLVIKCVNICENNQFS